MSGREERMKWGGEGERKKEKLVERMEKEKEDNLGSGEKAVSEKRKRKTGKREREDIKERKERVKRQERKKGKGNEKQSKGFPQVTDFAQRA